LGKIKRKKGLEIVGWNEECRKQGKVNEGKNTQVLYQKGKRKRIGVKLEKK